MRFGFVLMPVGQHSPRPYTDLVKIVQFGETLGFDSAWMPDQTFHRDPYAMLSAVALSTSRITLGVGATNPYTRHPAMTARATATLAEISGGRFVLAIGLGNRRDLLQPLGFLGDHAAERCKEAVVTIKGLLSGQVVSYESPTLTMRNVRLEMPILGPSPVYIGARGPRILQAAGAVADGAIVAGLASEGGLRFAIRQIRKGADSVGRTLQGFEMVSWVLVCVTKKKEDLLDAIRPTVAYIIGNAPSKVLDAVGISQGFVQRVKAAYAQGGLTGAAAFIDASVIDNFSIIGDAIEVAERIESLRSKGIGHLAILMPAATGSHPSLEFDLRQNLIDISEKVMPHVGKS